MYLIISRLMQNKPTPEKIIFPDAIYNEYRTIYYDQRQISLYVLDDGCVFCENFDFKFTSRSFLLHTGGSYKNNTSKVLSQLDEKRNFCETLNGIETNSYVAYCNVEDNVAKLLKGATCALPLYHSTHTLDNSFCFGSNPVHVACAVSPLEINYDFLARYIFGRYDDVCGRSETALKNINYVLPREKIFFNSLKIKKTKVEDFYYDKDLFDLRKQARKDFVIDLIKKKLTQNIQKQFDDYNGRRIGLALSSGMDSTTALVLAGSLGGQITTFTAAYEVDHESNEFDLARRLAADYGADWYPVNITHSQFVDKIENAYLSHPLPMPTSSSIGFDLIYDFCNDAKMGVVNFAGKADCWFAGNHPHYLYNLADLYSTDPVRFNDELEYWIKNHGDSRFPKDFDTFLTFYKKNCDLKVFGKILPNLTLVENDMLNPQKASEIFHSSNIDIANRGSYLKSYFDYYINFDNAHSLGRQASMICYGNKITDPFATSELYNIGMNLDSKYLINRGVGKQIIRELTTGILPDYILKNKVKFGFSTPFKKWMASGRLRDFINDTMLNLKGSEISSYFKDPNSVIAKLNDCDEMFTWQLLNAVLWEKHIIDYRKRLVIKN